MFSDGEQWGNCLPRRPDTRPSYVPCNHKMAITNKDPVKANRPGQPVVNKIAPLKLGNSPYHEENVWAWDQLCIHTPGSAHYFTKQVACSSLTP